MVVEELQLDVAPSNASLSDSAISQEVHVEFDAMCADDEYFRAKADTVPKPMLRARASLQLLDLEGQW